MREPTGLQVQPSGLSGQRGSGVSYKTTIRSRGRGPDERYVPVDGSTQSGTNKPLIDKPRTRIESSVKVILLTRWSVYNIRYTRTRPSSLLGGHRTREVPERLPFCKPVSTVPVPSPSVGGDPFHVFGF